MGEQKSLDLLLILTNESIFKNSEEIRIEMTFPGSWKKQKQTFKFSFLFVFQSPEKRVLLTLEEDDILIRTI